MPALHELDTRILAAEHQLMARQVRLCERWNTLGDHVREATRPQRLLAPAAGVAALLLALRGLRRREPVAASARADKPPIPWARLLAFGWPLMPERWRAKVPPAVVEAVVLFAPTLQALFSRL